MNVAELINQLQKIKNKDLPIDIWTDLYNFDSIIEIEETKDALNIYLDNINDL